MTTIAPWPLRLLLAASDRLELEHTYSDYILDILKLPIWSAQHPEGIRIPWRSGREASHHPSLKDAFASPGLYLFGTDKGIPRYIGKTSKSERTLWKRLWSRYIDDGETAKSQCQLAAHYEKQLQEHNIDGFPEEIRAWYCEDFGGTVRLRHAVDFAHHGIEGIWFTVLPIQDRPSVDWLEPKLIYVAQQWNQHQHFPKLLNVHHTRNYRHDLPPQNWGA